MNRKLLTRVSVTLIAGAALMFGQTETEAVAEAQMPPEAPVSTSPVAPQPTPQSAEEMTAIQGIMSAVTPDARIAAVDQFVLDYPASEFQGVMLQVATITAQMLNDYDRLMVYGERTLQADPENYTAMIAMAGALAQKTREHDLDKEEKLTRAENYANGALEILETAPRPNAAVTDAQWEAVKQDTRAEAHGALGFAAMAREDHEKAIAEFRIADETTVTPNPNVLLMLARELSFVERHGEAVTVLDALLAEPQTAPQIRQLAEQQRTYAMQQQESQ